MPACVSAGGSGTVVSVRKSRDGPALGGSFPFVRRGTGPLSFLDRPPGAADRSCVRFRRHWGGAKECGECSPDLFRKTRRATVSWVGPVPALRSDDRRPAEPHKNGAFGKRRGDPSGYATFSERCFSLYILPVPEAFLCVPYSAYSLVPVRAFARERALPCEDRCDGRIVPMSSLRPEMRKNEGAKPGERLVRFPRCETSGPSPASWR